MKALVFYQDIDSGSKIATEALLKSLAADQPQVEFIVYKQNPRRYEGQFAFLRNLIWSVTDFRKQLNSHTHLDVVYSAMYSSAVAQLLSRHRQTPLVLHLHGDQRFGLYQTRWPVRWIDPRFWYATVLGHFVLILQVFAVRFARSVIFVSQTARDEFLKRYHLEKILTKSTILVNGVDLVQYQPATSSHRDELRRRYGVSAPTIVYVGRMDEKKGVHHLLQSLAFLPTFPLTLIIAYPRPSDTYSRAYLRHLRQLAREVRSPHHTITFWRSPTPLELRALYQLATAVILPSQQEMMPLVMLEALASGTPFLVPAVGGVLEVLAPLQTLCILESVQPAYLARRIKEVCTLPAALRRAWQRQARAIALGYTWTNQAYKLATILEKVTRSQ